MATISTEQEEKERCCGGGGGDGQRRNSNPEIEAGNREWNFSIPSSNINQALHNNQHRCPSHDI
jgi:hypothetical protein